MVYLAMSISCDRETHIAKGAFNKSAECCIQVRLRGRTWNAELAMGS